MMRMDSKGIRNVKIVLVVAVVALLAVSVYEVANYGHEVKWKFTQPTIYSGEYYSAQWANGTIYVYHQLGSEKGFYALNQDGKVIWSLTEDAYDFTQPTVSPNGTVYMGPVPDESNNQSFSAFSPNGTILWSYAVSNGYFQDTLIGPEGNVYTNHLLQNGLNYLGCEFLSLSPDGHLLWRQWSQYAPSFIVSNNGTLLMCQDGNLTGYSLNGSILWKMPFSYFPSDSVQGNDALYFAMNAGLNESGRIGTRADLVAIGSNGSELWKYPDILEPTTNMANFECYGPVVDEGNGNIFFVRCNWTLDSYASTLYALGPDGTKLWEYHDTFMGPPAVHDGLVVIETNSGLTALDLDGNVEWKTNIGYSPYTWSPAPAIGSDGTVYATVNDGIVAVGKNPIVLELGLLILLPIIAICLFIIWRAKKGI